MMIFAEVTLLVQLTKDGVVDANVVVEPAAGHAAAAAAPSTAKSAVRAIIVRRTIEFERLSIAQRDVPSIFCVSL